MNVYDRWVFPPLLDLVMRQSQLEKYRREIVAAASGQVLEIGVGSGLNFPFYGEQVKMVIGIDPSPRLLAMARRRAEAARVRAELIQASATAIPVADDTIDTIVMTWTLCSILDPLTALREMRRVLKPDGRLLFIEHGLSPEEGVQHWQHRLTPMWGHISGGCHLDVNPLPRHFPRAFEVVDKNMDHFRLEAGDGGFRALKLAASRKRETRPRLRLRCLERELRMPRIR